MHLLSNKYGTIPEEYLSYYPQPLSDNVEVQSKEIRNISDTASDAIVTMNEDSEILSWNPAAAETFGYGVEEAS